MFKYITNITGTNIYILPCIAVILSIIIIYIYDKNTISNESDHMTFSDYFKYSIFIYISSLFVLYLNNNSHTNIIHHNPTLKLSDSTLQNTDMSIKTAPISFDIDDGEVFNIGNPTF